MAVLSVIIPTRNRSSSLNGVLSSLVRQTYPADLFEVIVVDNGSIDSTKEVFESYSSHIQNLHYYYDATPGLHVGRHVGLKMANADILVYADDDIEASPTWLEAIAESFKDTEVVLVGGKNLPKWEISPPDWILDMWKEDQQGNRILGYLSIIDLGDEQKEINPFFVFGCNFSIRKSVLLEAGGFHPDAMPQELIKYRGDGESYVSRFVCEKGYKAFYHPKASVNHLVPKTRLMNEYFMKRSFNQGISESYFHIRCGYKKSLLGMYLRLIKQVLIRYIIKKDLITRTKIAFLKGYLYHQRVSRKNKEINHWIMKTSYFD